MSCSHRSCPAGQTARNTSACARVRRIFVPCPLLRTMDPVNDNPAPRAPVAAQPLFWFGAMTVLGMAGALAAFL